MVDSEDSAPVPGAQVEIRSLSGTLVASGETDESGAFSRAIQYRGYAYERYSVSVSHSAYYSKGETFLVDDPTVPVNMNLELEPTKTIVEDVDEEGDPVPDAVVLVVAVGSDQTINGQTDAGGHFLPQGLAAGDYNVTVTKEGFDPGNARFTYHTDEPIRIVLTAEEADDAVPFTIFVVEKGTGEPVEGLLLSVSERGGGYVQVFTDQNGSFTIQNDGTYQRISSATKYFESFSIPVPAPESGIESRTIEVHKMLSGTVINKETGEPYVGVEVGWYAPVHIRVSITDEQGRFFFYPRLDGITETYPYGYELFLYVEWQKEGHAEMRQQFRVQATGEPLVLEATYVECTVSGIVVNKFSGEPQPDTHVTMTILSSNETHSVNTGHDARFNFWVDPYPYDQTALFRVAWPSDDGVTRVEIFYVNLTGPIVVLETVYSPGTSSNSQGMVQANMVLCANEECTERNTGADGASATWEISPAAEMRMAQPTGLSAGMVGVGPDRLFAAQTVPPVTYTLSAVVQNGAASATMEIPLGYYTVCLKPVLEYSDGSSIRIADDPLCSSILLTEQGVEGETAQFNVMMAADTVDQETPPAATVPPSTNTAPSGDSETEPVTGLPSTGTGTLSGLSAQWMLLGGFVGISAMIAVGLRQTSRNGSQACVSDYRGGVSRAGISSQRPPNFQKYLTP